MSTSQTILSNAAYHADLLRTRDSIEYAPSALAEQTRYVADLRAQLEQVKEKVDKLAGKTKKERKEHEDLRDSMVRRMASTVVGKKEKFEARKAKEEREYVEALETEMRERENQSMLEEMIVEATKTKLDLEEKTDRLKLIQAEIANLYDRVFSGPTQEFPRDDQLESQLATAQETYDSIQAQLNSVSQAVSLLRKADTQMKICVDYMNDALHYSMWDIYGGSSMTDMMERNALAKAANSASKAELLVHQARRADPQVQALPSLRVHDISMIGDVFFDNVFSDIHAHEKIQNNADELRRAHKRLKSEFNAAKARAQQIGADLIEATEVLTECRKELERFRRETFERVGGMGNTSGTGAGMGVTESSDSLPSYESSAVQGPSTGSVFAPPPGPPPGHGHPQPSSAGDGIPVYPPPPGPPPGHAETAASTSTPGTGQGVVPMSIPMSTPSSSSAPNRSPLSFSPQRQIYPPPPGPPPGHSSPPYVHTPSSPSYSYLPPPGPSSPSRPQSQSQSLPRPVTHGRTLSAGSNKDLPALPSEAGAPSSEASSRPSGGPLGGSSRTASPAPAVPMHWGSRNPFAASMMGDHDHDGRVGRDEKGAAR